MGVVVRQSVKSVIITIIGIVLGGIVTVLSMRYFPKSEYGFTQNLIKITLQASFLGLFGFNFAVLIHGQRYPPGHPSRGAFMTVCAAFPVLFSLLITIAFFAFKSWFLSLYNADDRVMMQQFFAIFPLLTLLTVAATWLSSYLQSIQKNALQNLAQEVLFRIAYIGLIVCYGLKWLSFSQFIWLFLAIWLIPVGYLLFIALHVGKLQLTVKIPFPRSEIKEIVRFSGYHMLTAVSTVLIFQLDAILLGPLAANGLAAVAVYSVATLAISMLRNPTRVIATTAVPSFSRAYKEGNIRQLSQLFDRSCVNMQIIALGMFAFILLDMDFIQRVVTMIKEGYDGIKALIVILMIGQMADMISGFNYQVLSVSKYYRFNFWISVGLLVLVFGLNYVLIQDFGIYGAAWATTIGMIVFNIVKSWFVWKKLRMQPFSKKSLLVLGAATIAFLAAWLIPETGFQYLDLGIKNMLLGGIFLGLILKWRVSDEIRGLMVSIKKKITR
ncbi:MAG TPA: polysaccharide biosynthesis C-terminal domain-containing protein [Edaphocola sp.]|nr:polysaccharide biosynthesis C-terminal domain-containing protein [Edaphocola sp.]